MSKSTFCVCAAVLFSFAANAPASEGWLAMVTNTVSRVQNVLGESVGYSSENASTRNGTPLLEPDEYEKALAQKIINHPQQQRSELVYDPHLHLVARAKVVDMARRKYKGHVDPDGFGPNFVVRSLGYELPKHYSTARNGNNLESFAWRSKSVRGDADQPAIDPDELAAEFVKMWYNSPGHKKHLLGQGFNSNQTRFGIGHVQADSDTRRRGGGRQTRSTYAVFITAPPSLTEPPPLTAKIVDDYLSRTPAERQREATARKSP